LSAGGAGSASATTVTLPPDAFPGSASRADQSSPPAVAPRTVPLGFSSDGRWIYGAVISPQLASLSAEFRVATAGDRTELVKSFNVGRPDGLAVTTHMCRGNNQSMWAAEGGYEFVAEALFSNLEVDGFFLEYDDERSGGFEPLRFVPPGKCVVLGLVTTKRPLLEQKDALKRRIEQAARHVDIDQLCLSPQCGFSSTVEGNRLTIDDEIAKLRLVVETAAEVWG
jgi:methionine synthase II (cobalamin-independent)